MIVHTLPGRPHRQMVIGVGVLLVCAAPCLADSVPKLEYLHIGTTESVVDNSPQEAGADPATDDNLRSFIKSETGFDNDVTVVENYQVLGQRLAAGKLQLGLFMGYEFAWARAKFPKLRPLVLAVNKQPYRYACLVVRRDSKAADFAGLKGSTLALPEYGAGYLRLFVNAQSRGAGCATTGFFSRITMRDNVETILDDVVDGNVQAAVVERTALEAYQRRKPGRFDELKTIVQSEAMPPMLAAYYDGMIDAATLRRFQERLTTVHKKKQGEEMLTLFRLTGFTEVPADLDGVLADTLKKYPPPSLPTR
jgi:ABC-type phosphate/phosphonate transport system substrate-binding protein